MQDTKILVLILKHKFKLKLPSYLHYYIIYYKVLKTIMPNNFKLNLDSALALDYLYNTKNDNLSYLVLTNNMHIFELYIDEYKIRLEIIFKLMISKNIDIKYFLKYRAEFIEIKHIKGIIKYDRVDLYDLVSKKENYYISSDLFDIFKYQSYKILKYLSERTNLNKYNIDMSSKLYLTNKDFIELVFDIFKEINFIWLLQIIKFTEDIEIFNLVVNKTNFSVGKILLLSIRKTGIEYMLSMNIHKLGQKEIDDIFVKACEYKLINIIKILSPMATDFSLISNIKGYERIKFLPKIKEIFDNIYLVKSIIKYKDILSMKYFIENKSVLSYKFIKYLNKNENIITDINDKVIYKYIKYNKLDNFIILYMISSYKGPINYDYIKELCLYSGNIEILNIIHDYNTDIKYYKTINFESIIQLYTYGLLNITDCIKYNIELNISDNVMFMLLLESFNYLELIDHALKCNKKYIAKYIIKNYNFNRNKLKFLILTKYTNYIVLIKN